MAETSDRQTALVAFDVTRHGQLVGGPHTVLNNDLQEAVVVQDSRESTFIYGRYHEILHANMATVKGRRFVLTAYAVEMS